MGGLVGINNGTVTNSYWNWETSGQTTSKGGTKKSTDEMKLQSTYTNWDFSTIWTMTENQTYPGLRKLNNIPFVLDDDFIIDVKSFDLSNLLLNDFDIETDVADLTMKILSCTTGSIIGNTLVFPEDSIAGTKSVIVYRLGEILATDTLWGNIATATITLNLKGGGSPDNPYLIHTYEELKKIASVSLSAHYRLVADIDASASATENSGSGFQPIGNYSGTPFTGKLNGSGHIISRLSIKRTEQNYIGLFGYLGNESVVDSLGLINADISGKGYVGALVGINDGNVFGCFSTGAVDGSGNYVGGMSGNNNAGKVAFSYSDCSVSGALLVGGLVGYNNDSISNCYATGTVNCTFDKIGGLIGYNDVLGVVTDSYSIGTISGGVQQGGLIGSNNSGTITNSYWNIETSGIVVSAGGTGLNTAQMKLQSSFEDWDFDESWDIVDNVSYPYSRKVNNASIAVNDSLICGYKFDLLRLLENDFDVETGKEKLVFRILSHSTGSITDSTLILPETNEVGIACTLVYRIGEVLAGDTLWGNKATAVLIRNIEGLGTEENPFILKTYEDLRNIADVSLSSVYRIVNDIDASASTTDNNGSGFEPVGNYNPSTPFTGKLHGGGHIISNLTINRSGFNFIGIFSYLGAGSLVDSLGLTNVYVRGKGYVGAFVGINDGTLINCYSIGSVIGSSDYIGGLVGDNYTYGNVTSCYSECSVTGNSSVGGLVGYNGKTITKSQASGNVAGYKNVGGLTGVNHYGSTVSYSSATGIVTGKSGAENIGGLVGNNESATISYCYATGNVNNPGSIIDNDGFGFSVGGLAGYNGGNISNCYAIGSVNTGDCYYVGGLIGENKDGSVNYCYFAGGINKSNSSGGGIFGVSWTPVNPTSFFNTAVIGETSSEIGASGKITSEMVLQSTFSGWNFNTIWTIDEGKSYPYFRITSYNVCYTKLLRQRNK